MIDTKTEISKVTVDGLNVPVKTMPVAADNRSYVIFVDLEKNLFEGRPYVEQDYSDSEMAKIDSMLDKICRTGGY